MFRRALSRLSKLFSKSERPATLTSGRRSSFTPFVPRLEILETREVPNAAPVLEALGNRFIAPGHQFYAQAWATDADRDWVTYTAALPAGLNINSTTGTITGVLPAGMFQANQVIAITVTASDGNGGTANQNANLTVTPAPNTWVVNTVQDTIDNALGDGVPLDVNGKVSLRAAVQQANFNRQGDIKLTYITFDPTVFMGPTTINLLSELPPITADLTINGPGMETLFISGPANQRGIIKVPLQSGVVAVLTGLTLQNGTHITIAQTLNPQTQEIITPATSGYGGAIENLGTTFLNGVRIRGSSATLGGGMFTTRSLTVIDSLIINNTANQQGGNLGNGGGITGFGGHMTLTGSTIQDNHTGLRGGGIALISAAQAFLHSTSLIHNTAFSDGAGVYVSGGSWLAMLGGRIERNEAGGSGGGVRNETVAFFKDVTFDANKAVTVGGGIDAAGGTTVLTSCTFVGLHIAPNGGPKVAKTAGAFFDAIGCIGFDKQTETFVY